MGPKFEISQQAKDLFEALTLLSKAGPNPLLISEAEYWERYEKLTDKYFEKDEEEDE